MPRTRSHTTEQQRRQQLADLITWMRHTYGGIGAADVVNAATQEGIHTTHEEAYELLRHHPTR